MAKKKTKPTLPPAENDNYYPDREQLLSLSRDLAWLAGCQYGTRVERPVIDRYGRKITMRFVVWPSSLPRPIGEANVPPVPELVPKK